MTDTTQRARELLERQPHEDDCEFYEGEPCADFCIEARALRALSAALSNKAEGEEREVLRLLRNDLAEEDAELHAQRIAVIDAALTTDGIAGREAMDWFGGQRNLELAFYRPTYSDEDDLSEEWRIWRVSGPINDREWDQVGAGETPMAAIEAAYAAIRNLAKREEG